MSVIPLLYLFGFLFSVPSFLICYAGLRFLIQCDLSYETRLLLWLLVSAGSTVTAFSLCLLLFDLRTVIELLPFVLAAVVATWVSILIRFNQFIYFMHIKTKEYENDLV